MVLNHPLQDLFDLVKTSEGISLPTFKQTSVKIKYELSDQPSMIYSSPEPVLPFANSKIFKADVIECRRLSAEDPKCKDVYEISFDVTDSNINFKPGDTIGIIPQNLEEEIDIVIKRLNLENVMEMKYILSISNDCKKSKIPVHLPVEGTLKHVLTHCVELRGVVRKGLLQALSIYTLDDLEKKVLEYLCSKEGSLSYTCHILNKNICIIDLLTLFKSCKPPVEVLLEYLPRLLPRPYSIVNSGMKQKDTIKICFSVMDVGNNRKGLTTGWLQGNCTEDSIEGRLKSLRIHTMKVPLYLRKNINGFTLPQDPSLPIIMIGPGTGVAPFIGFLEEREAQKESSSDIGYSWLFFGCRHPKLDYIYEDKLKNFVNNGVLNRLCVAFSRMDKDRGSYVQDDINQNGEEVSRLIMEGAYVYLCGDVNKFAKDIKEILIKCIETHAGLSREDAQTYISDMVKQKRYLVDIWS